MFGNWIARESSIQTGEHANGSNSTNSTIDHPPSQPLEVEALPLDKLMTVTMQANQSKYYTLTQETLAGISLKDDPLVHIHLSNLKGTHNLNIGAFFMCLYPSDHTEPQTFKDCWINNRGDMMVPIKDILAKVKGCTVRVSPLKDDPQIPNLKYSFSILLTTQLSETILSSGVWDIQIGKFVHKKYTGYFNSSAESVSLFIQSKFKKVAGNIWLIPLENFNIDRLPNKTANYNNQLIAFTFDKATIQRECDPTKCSVVIDILKSVSFL